MYASFDFSVDKFCDPEQLDRAAKLFRIRNISGRDARNALCIDVLEIDRGSIREVDENRQLVRRIDPSNIKRGVGFGISGMLRILKNLLEAVPFMRHS